jgi:hypothetical protein
MKQLSVKPLKLRWKKAKNVVGGSSRSAHLWTAPDWQGESARRQGVRPCGRPINALSASSLKEACVPRTLRHSHLYRGGGTLGGLVGTAPRFAQILEGALERSRICSNDPICGDHQPDNRSGDRATHDQHERRRDTWLRCGSIEGRASHKASSGLRSCETLCLTMTERTWFKSLKTLHRRFRIRGPHG